MLAVPLVSLVALWGFAASITISPALKDANYTANTKTTNAGVYPLSASLPQERAETYLYLLSGRQSGRPALLAARQQLDKAIPGAKAAFLASQTSSSSAVLNTLITDLGQLGNVRSSVDSGALSPLAAFQKYSDIVDAEFHFFLTTVQNRGDHSLDATSVGAVDGAYALDMAGREAAIIDGAFANGGRLTPAIREQFAGAAAQRLALLAETQALVTPAMYASYVNDSPTYRKFESMETQILASSGSRVPVDPAAWNSTTQAYLLATQKTQGANAGTLAALSGARSSGLVTEAALAGGVGLVAVVASVFLVIWFGRKVTGDLTRLDGNVRRADGGGAAATGGRTAAPRRGRGRAGGVAARLLASGIREVSRIAASSSTVSMVWGSRPPSSRRGCAGGSTRSS